MIVPFAAGGTTDVTARIVGEHMSRTLGQQIIVENVVGAGGTVGTARAMRANPDGHTLKWAKWEPTPPRWLSIRTWRTNPMSISNLLVWSAGLHR
jgi:tripartite-type tricarboxylate transporter receptor subunit TctC